METGTVYFFTGLSGAGKTTIGGLFYRRLRARKPNVILADGDQMRPVFGDDLGYSPEDRLKGSQRGFRLWRELANQGIDVVVCGISMFSAVRDWNRENIENYKEIYVKVTPETLLRRNQKGLYTSGQKNVVGLDLPFDEPKQSDVVIQNDGQQSPEAVVEQLFKLFHIVEE